MSWWLDGQAVYNTLLIRRSYEVPEFVETGTFRGINLKFWAYYFSHVSGCEINEEYFKISQERLKTFINVTLVHESSPTFLQKLVQDYCSSPLNKHYIIFFLDAHFYDPTLTNKFIIIDELKALAGFDKAIIIVHDFKVKDMGHLIYDNQPLDFDLVKESLYNVNPDFSYYTNLRDKSAAHTLESIKYVRGLEPDTDTIETINYHNTDWLKYRGILYCLPNQYKLERL